MTILCMHKTLQQLIYLHISLAVSEPINHSMAQDFLHQLYCIITTLLLVFLLLILLTVAVLGQKWAEHSEEWQFPY